MRTLLQAINVFLQNVRKLGFLDLLTVLACLQQNVITKTTAGTTGSFHGFGQIESAMVFCIHIHLFVNDPYF